MIRLVVADSSPLLRAGLKRIIADWSDVRVVGEAASREEVLLWAAATAADVLLLESSLSSPRGILELIRQVKQRDPRMRVLVLNVERDDRQALRMLRSGAAAYLTKEHSAGDLVEVIRKVARGRQ